MGQLSWILLQASLANLVFFVSVLVAALPVTGSAGSVANNNNEGTVCLPLSKYNEISKGGTQDLKSAGSKQLLSLFASPTYITKHAMLFETTFELGYDFLKFRPAGRDRSKLFQLHLISPGRMLDTQTYSINIKFWKIRETDDNDVFVAICDQSHCVGFLYYDQGGYQLAEWSTSSICSSPSGSSSWGNVREQIWETKYELMPHHTWATTMSPVFSKATAGRFSATLKPSQGLWLVVCRHNGDEEHNFRYFEISVMQN
jgi:hypothetical protein